jgi:type IV pilus assembly protein PilV
MKKIPGTIRAPRARPRLARGMNMVEVLVAILILVFGLLGIAAMQATTLRNTQSAMQHSEAVTHSYGMVDRLRADIPHARIGNYNLGNLGTDLGGSGTTVWTCALPDAGALPANERRQWISLLKDDLGPDACGIVDCDSTTCGIAVKWDDSRGTGGSSAQRVVTRTRL